MNTSLCVCVCCDNYQGPERHIPPVLLTNRCLLLSLCQNGGVIEFNATSSGLWGSSRPPQGVTSCPLTVPSTPSCWKLRRCFHFWTSAQFFIFPSLLGVSLKRTNCSCTLSARNVGVQDSRTVWTWLIVTRMGLILLKDLIKLFYKNVSDRLLWCPIRELWVSVTLACLYLKITTFKQKNGYFFLTKKLRRLHDYIFKVIFYFVAVSFGSAG